jgi:hypothetical protein
MTIAGRRTLSTSCPSPARGNSVHITARFEVRRGARFVATRARCAAIVKREHYLSNLFENL